GDRVLPLVPGRPEGPSPGEPGGAGAAGEQPGGGAPRPGALGALPVGADDLAPLGPVLLLQLLLVLLRHLAVELPGPELSEGRGVPAGDAGGRSAVLRSLREHGRGTYPAPA